MATPTQTLVWTVAPEGIVTTRPHHTPRHGITLRPYGDDGRVLWRTTGKPATVRKILEYDRHAIKRVCRVLDLDLALLVAIAATETAGKRRKSRREPDGRTSYGIFQTLLGTASEQMGAKVTPAQLYEVEFAAIVALKYIRGHAKRTTRADGTIDPIRVSADYNAGSPRRSTRNPWGLIVTKDHLDRMAAWYGDARAVLG